MDEYESPRRREGNDSNKSPGPIHDYEQYMYGGSVGRDRIEENSPNATIEELDEDDEQILDLAGIDEKSERQNTTSSSDKEQSNVVVVNHRNAGWGEIAEPENISEEKAEAEREIGEEVLAGALKGDFNDDPTFWSSVGQIATGLIPIAGQLGDARDLIHALDDICNQEGYKKIGSWAALVLIVIGFVPGVGDFIKGIGKTGIRYLDNNRITKQIGQWLGDNIISPILKRVRDLTAPIVGQIKDAIRRKLDEAQEIARGLGEGVDNVIDDVTGRPQVATEGAGSVNPSRIESNQPRGNEPSRMQSTGTPDGSFPETTTYKASAVSKFRSTIGRIRTLAKKHGFEIPKGINKPATQQAIKDYVDFIIKNGETRVGAYKPTGGGDLNALWTKYEDTIVLRRSNGEFITFFNATEGGQALNSPFINP